MGTVEDLSSYLPPGENTRARQGHHLALHRGRREIDAPDDLT
jgi:hypothetical protein